MYIYIILTLRSPDIYKYIEIVYYSNFMIDGYRRPSNLSADRKVHLIHILYMDQENFTISGQIQLYIIYGIYMYIW